MPALVTRLSLTSPPALITLAATSHLLARPGHSRRRRRQSPSSPPWSPPPPQPVTSPPALVTPAAASHFPTRPGHSRRRRRRRRPPWLIPPPPVTSMPALHNIICVKMPHFGIVSCVSIARLVRTRGDRRIVETDITTVSSIAIYIAIYIAIPILVSVSLQL